MLAGKWPDEEGEQSITKVVKNRLPFHVPVMRLPSLDKLLDLLCGLTVAWSRTIQKCTLQNTKMTIWRPSRAQNGLKIADSCTRKERTERQTGKETRTNTYSLDHSQKQLCICT